MKFAKLDPKAMAYTFSIFGGFWTFVIAFLGQFGFEDLVTICNPFYLFDLSTWLGVFLGTIEALVFWLFMGYVFAWLYNKFV